VLHATAFLAVWVLDSTHFFHLSTVALEIDGATLRSGLQALERGAPPCLVLVARLNTPGQRVTLASHAAGGAAVAAMQVRLLFEARRAVLRAASLSQQEFLQLSKAKAFPLPAAAAAEAAEAAYSVNGAVWVAGSAASRVAHAPTPSPTTTRVAALSTKPTVDVRGDEGAVGAQLGSADGVQAALRCGRASAGADGKMVGLRWRTSCSPKPQNPTDSFVRNEINQRSNLLTKQ
jgi:hypothetical protein